MPESATTFPSPSRIIHEPARLAILVTLASVSSGAADFQLVQRATGLSKGNLSVQLTKLEKAGLVKSSKEIVHRKTRTTLRLSGKGRAELGEYWRTMDEIRALMAPREDLQPSRADAPEKPTSVSSVVRWGKNP